MARPPLVLIISTLVEPNVDRLIPLLEKRGAKWFRFNTELFPLMSRGSIRLGDKHSAAISSLEKNIRLEDVSTVWNRRHSRPVLPPGLSPFEQRFVENESAAFHLAAYEHAPCNWINDWRAERDASSKALQLQVAVQEGFRVPKTLITNDPLAVREFVDFIDGPVLFKSLAGTAPTTMDYTDKIKRWLGRRAPKLAAPRADRLNDAPIAFSELLSAKHLSKIDSVRVCPTVFQEYIAKKHELRVTIVGSDIFAAEIHSQDDRATRVDFRRFALTRRVPKHRKANLRPATAERLLRTMRRLRLSFGCADLIVTPDGEDVFLEINPSGQWQWVQQHTGLAIDDALADMLVSQLA
ncbi:MAG: MvdC/MvdD family ATP grasp protein [Polyangiaceae bacterium]